jgi:phage regulator Rha-like protein
MSQTQASDQWAYFQAKSIKGYLYEMQKEQYELTLKDLSGKAAQATVADYKKKIAEYEKKIARYDSEKAQIQKDAKALETVRDDAKNHGQAFGIAVIFLQIAILLASIAALMKKKPLWFLSMAVGLAGIVYFINGFFLFM